MLETLDFTYLGAYALICIGIGVYGSKRQKDDDFLIAGRELGFWGFSFSVLASYIGGSAPVAYSAFVYQFGLSAITLFAGTAVGFLLFIPYAKKIRAMAREREFLTLSDWFYHHYGKKVGMLSAIIMLLVYLGLLMNQFIAGSSILSSISGWSYESSLLFSGSVILVYLVLGGFKSVIKTDIFQYLIILVLFTVFLFILFTEQHTPIKKLLTTGDVDWGMTIGFIVYGILSVFYASEYWQRIYAARDNQVIVKGFRHSAILILITGFVLSLIGLYARVEIPGIEAKDALASGLGQIFPRAFLGIGLVLIFAAIMSSADTMIFVLASSIAKEVIHPLSSEGLDQHQLAKYTRIFISIISVLSIVAAFFFRNIIAVVMTIAGVGFAIVPPIFASFHWKMKERAVFASLLSGSIYVLILIFSGLLISELAVASVLVSALVLIVFQRFGK